MTKGRMYQPGGVEVWCRRCGWTRLIAFDEAPFIYWPPQCERCRVPAPMVAKRTLRRVPLPTEARE